VRTHDAAAHELGHVIAHILTSTHFDFVWIAGVNEQQDKYYQSAEFSKRCGGYVKSYRWGKMTFDGVRVRCISREDQDADAGEWLLVLLAGIAGEEVAAGQERPRSVIDLSDQYRTWEFRPKSEGDFEQAKKWFKRGADAGYIHARDVWAAFQHYYDKAFYAVRDHKEFLFATIPLLTKRGVMYNTSIMKLWNGFYAIEPTVKDSKKKLLYIQDNGTQGGKTMKLTELETFVLHDLSTKKVNGGIKDDVLQAYTGNYGVGGYNKFAYVDGRRYDVRLLNKKVASILYFLQRTGLVTLNDDKTIATHLPKNIAIPPKATVDVWLKDFTAILDAFKLAAAAEDTPDKSFNTCDLWYVVKSSPVQDAALTKAYEHLQETVRTIGALRQEENYVRQAADWLGRDLVTLKTPEHLRLRFVLELSAPALKAAAVQFHKDCIKPEGWDKMKKKEQAAYSWTPMVGGWVTDILNMAEAETLVDNYCMLNILGRYMTAESAHAAWRVEAARRHPDQGGSTEASAAFGAVWDRVEKAFPKAATKAVLAGK
jgi:hypothetical protein